MNAEVLDYLSLCCETVPHEPWLLDDVFRAVARGGQKILVAGDGRWAENCHVDVAQRIDRDGMRAGVLVERRYAIEFHDGSEIDFLAPDSTARLAGRRWHVAFLQQFMASTVNEPGAMPVYRIPSQADWTCVADAQEAAQEFLRDHQGEVEFDFQGRRYKVPYGCDYCVQIGSLMPESRFQFGFTGWRAPTQPLEFSGLLASDSVETVSPTYAGISRSPAPQVPEETMRQLAALEYQAGLATMSGNTEGAAMVRQQSEDMYERARQQAAARFADLMMRPSPVFERLRGNNRDPYSGGADMVNPIQFRLPDPVRFDPDTGLRWSQPPGDPLDFPTLQPGRRINAVHLSEIAEYTIGPSARELDLQRRLDTVRECITSMPNPIVFRYPVMAQRFMEAISPVPPVQDSDSYVYRYEFVNGQAIKVDDKLTGGTILDAAARPVRKFRVVED